VNAADAQIRISRDVAVQAEHTSGELAVLSDAAGVIGEELTLALVNGAGERELRVKVVDSRPHLVNGAVRHRVRLEIVSAGSIAADAESERSS
jgi:hypothetical protein